MAPRDCPRCATRLPPNGDPCTNCGWWRRPQGEEPATDREGDGKAGVAFLVLSWAIGIALVGAWFFTPAPAPLRTRAIAFVAYVFAAHVLSPALSNGDGSIGSTLRRAYSRDGQWEQFMSNVAMILLPGKFLLHAFTGTWAALGSGRS